MGSSAKVPFETHIAAQGGGVFQGAREILSLPLIPLLWEGVSQGGDSSPAHTHFPGGSAAAPS